MTAPLPPLPFFPERLRDYLMPAERVIVERLLRDYAKLAVREALERAVGIAEHWGHDTPSVIRAMIEEYKND